MRATHHAAKGRPARRRHPAATWLLPTLVVLAVLVLTGIGARVLCIQLDRIAALRADAAVDRAVEELRDRLDRLATLLAALTAFEAGSEEVTEDEFLVFLDIVAQGRPLEAAFPGLGAVIVLESDPAGLRIRHLARAADDLTAAQLQACEACLRALATSVTAPEPIAASTGLRPETAARLGGEVLLVEAFPGLDPVPLTAGPPPGWTVLAVDVGALTADVGPPGDSAPIGLIDGGENVLLVGTDAQAASRSVSVFGTTWLLSIPVPTDLLSPLERGLVLGAALTGLLLATALGTVVRTLAVARARALGAVAEATEELGRTNERLAASNERLRRANTELQEFTGVVAHDLKSPLTSIKGLTELVRDGRVEAERSAEILGRVVTNTDRLATMIDELLEYASAGRTIGARVPVCLTEVVTTTLERLESRIAERRASVEVGALPTGCGDRNRLVEVFQHLINNALVHVPADRDPVVRITARQRFDHVEVVVGDNGHGIPPAEREAALQVFHRGADTEHGSGTGLGLPTVDRIIAAHGGRLTLGDSELGGLAVRFTLPDC